ncbi:unnamed protein product [Adineta steineri]|uniref:Uncharacterized protein n=1 Tax=Adineta steineri TaxID=433720 RepID=A0A813WRD2_9BILA|nr:unnamed protein product [Adineta steineri]
MQVANRATRRYITPPANNRTTTKKPTQTPSISHSSPKKAVDTSVQKSNEPSTIKKLVDRFRHDEPQPRPERDSVNSDFWWLHDELKQTYESETDKDDDRRSNIPDFIEIFPSTDIDQDLNRRASLLLTQTPSEHSSDVGHISSVGVGSTPSQTMTTTTTSTFQSAVREQPTRPIFTRINTRFDMKNDGSDDDILYQWRLRRRLEQAQNNEPITFPSKITNISPRRSHFPSIPIEIPQVLPPLPPPPPPPPVVKPLSPKQEQQQSSATNTESDSIKQCVTTPIPIRKYSEIATQTLQDACIQTSPTSENCLSSSNLISNEVDLRPTRDDNHHSSVWHRPPPRSKCEITQISSSPPPVKRHHHRHHHHHSFRPVLSAGHSTTNDNHHQYQRSSIYPSNTVQSSQDSTLTHVTSIMINDNYNTDNHYPIRNNNHSSSIVIIDESHVPQQDDNDDDHIDYSSDDILNILIQKRDELMITFR